MKIIYDVHKLEQTLRERGLDFADARQVFSGRTLTLLDDREEYDEVRYQTYGLLHQRVVMLVWTPRGADRRIISMRYCHEKEAKKVKTHLA